eukprot:6467463-Amphidinium_carterae.1
MARGSGDPDPWDIPEEDPWEGDSEAENADCYSLSADGAGQELYDFLVTEFLKGKLTAKQVCVTAFYASTGGVEAVKPLALRPDASSGNFSRHLSAVLQKGQAETDFKGCYTVPLVAYLPTVAERGVHNMQVLCPHEVLAGETQGLNLPLAVERFERMAPPAYFDHPTKQAAGQELCVPYALFLDAFQYSNIDGAIAVVLTNLLTGVKHCIACLRKKWLCGGRCGCACSGWCTLHCLFRFLHWSIEVLAGGTFPTSRHSLELLDVVPSDGWLPNDAGRKEVAGNPLGFKGVCLQVRGDLAELTTGLGFSTWQAKATPCLLCSQPSHEWFTALGDRDAARPLRLGGNYAAECEACCTTIEPVNEETWLLLQSALTCDHKKGLVLAYALPGYGLQVGDRVEPHASMLDIHAKSCPPKLVFWRDNKNVCAKHHNVMLSHALGTSMELSCSLDVMHTWCLGVYQLFLHRALWSLLESTAFSGDNLKLRGQELAKDLRVWYTAMAKAQPTVKLSRCENFSVEHTLGGSRDKNVVRLKAHQGLTLMRYMVQTLQKHEAVVAEGAQLLELATCYLAMYDLLKRSPMVVPEGTLQVSIN